MTTVMSWGNSEGEKGRCDAKCHNATTPHCDCMCGGRYHGSGANGTFEEVRREHAAEILEAAKRQAASQGFSLAAVLEQQDLFRESSR
jgi:hypothetical protein